jgi:uncharacterized membrane protein YphA (DoxX/SURF4 family)
MWRERTHQVGWVLLPLRAFLAFVFIYGGISKIADNRFLDGSSPLSMHASVAAVRNLSPIGGLLGPVEAHSFGFGVLMAAAEMAVGLGMLLGLFTRIAAIGGIGLALSLWLTVSWGAQPWFTSADLVYLFAFTPLLIAGAGGVLSADAWLAQRRAAQPGAAEDRTRRIVLAGGVAVAGAAILDGSALFRRSGHKTTTAAGGASQLESAEFQSTDRAGAHRRGRRAGRRCAEGHQQQRGRHRLGDPTAERPVQGSGRHLPPSGLRRRLRLGQRGFRVSLPPIPFRRHRQGALWPRFF